MAKCPFCEMPVSLKTNSSETNDEVCREIKGTLKKEVMYSCPHCGKVLGFGYYMGGWFSGRP